MSGYYTYYIDVWDEHLKQLHSHGEFKTQQAAVAQLGSDEYPIPDFPEYINKIKEYLTN